MNSDFLLCSHNHVRTGHYYVTCQLCGAIKTDSDKAWGIAANRWFRTENEAWFYKANGRLPDPPTDPKASRPCARCDTCNDLIVVGYCRDCAHTMADATEAFQAAVDGSTAAALLQEVLEQVDSCDYGGGGISLALRDRIKAALQQKRDA